MATVLVVGAAGMLGREVARLAGLRGAEVVRTGRLAAPGWKTFDALVDGPEGLFDREVDLVVNCAAVLASDIDLSSPASVAAAERVNAEFPHVLADAAARHRSRIVHISTDAVFPTDAGVCTEDTPALAADVYGRTKLLGEPLSESALTLRCSFLGRDPRRGRGLLEWLLAHPPGALVPGFVDQAWNGLTSVQVAAACCALLDGALFARARAEGAVHHLFEDPPISKCEVLELCAEAGGLDVTILPRASGHPSSRLLATRHAVLGECLESFPKRAATLAELIARSKDTHV